MKFTKVFERARFKRMQAVAADPAVASHIGRHMKALKLMLLGSDSDAEPTGPIVQAGFRLSAEERNLMMAAAQRLQSDFVHLEFDVEHPLDAPTGLVVVRIEGEHVACYPECALWALTGSRRSVIVSLAQSARYQFVVDAEPRLGRRDGWPAPSIDAGLRRAAHRLKKLATSGEMGRAHVGVSRAVIGSDRAGRWTYEDDKVSA